MKHITEMLDRSGFARLDAVDAAVVREHAASCPDCARALAASRLAADMLQARAAVEAPQPSPFFSQKVLAALREKQAVRRPMEAFRRWWSAAYPMVCTMMLVCAAFAALTVFAPRYNNTGGASATPDGLYTADVIFNQRPPRNVTTEQALEVIYTSTDRPGKR